MPYRTLKSDSIIKTARRLNVRVGERFPGRGIEKVSAELVAVSEQLASRALAIGKPFLGLRLLSAIISLLGLAGLSIIIWQNYQHFTLQTEDLGHFEGLEAILNMVVLTAAGLWFLLNLETRIKRNRILDDMHILRSIAHVIDMHQLTKDPVAVCFPERRTKSSPVRELTPFELLRYLDYMTEMLSLIGKVAALYLERINDTEVNRSVNEIEELTTNLSRKIWQKISMIEAAEAEGGMAHLSQQNAVPASQSTDVAAPTEHAVKAAHFELDLEEKDR